MTLIGWIVSIPILFILPGLLPSRIITGRVFSGWTLAWAVFFSVVLLPPLCFAMAMLFGTTVRLSWLIPLALVLGVIGLVFPGRSSDARTDAGDGDL